jgi:hypothetical protein
MIGAGILGAGLLPSLWLVGLCLFFEGIGNGMINVAALTLITVRSPEQIRGSRLLLLYQRRLHDGLPSVRSLSVESSCSGVVSAPTLFVGGGVMSLFTLAAIAPPAVRKRDYLRMKARRARFRGPDVLGANCRRQRESPGLDRGGGLRGAARTRSAGAPTRSPPSGPALQSGRPRNSRVDPATRASSSARRRPRRGLVSRRARRSGVHAAASRKSSLSESALAVLSAGPSTRAWPSTELRASRAGPRTRSPPTARPCASGQFVEKPRSTALAAAKQDDAHAQVDPRGRWSPGPRRRGRGRDPQPHASNVRTEPTGRRGRLRRRRAPSAADS